jgi:hypothetical protein
VVEEVGEPAIWKPYVAVSDLEAASKCAVAHGGAPA